MAPVSTSAVLLRGHAYGDSSRILRFYTLEHGLLSVMARGVRGKNGKGNTTLSSYATGMLTAYVRPQRDLHTMKDFECGRLRVGLGADVRRFAGAAATAELVLVHADQESHPDLFRALEYGLDLIETCDTAAVPAASLSALWQVTEAFGFAPELDHCVLCAEALGPEEIGRFDFPAGGVRCAECGEGAAGPQVGPIARAQIRGLVTGRPEVALTHPRRHLGLLSDFVAFHVASRPLKSFHFLGTMMPEEEPTPA